MKCNKKPRSKYYILNNPFDDWENIHRVVNDISAKSIRMITKKKKKMVYSLNYSPIIS